MSEYAAFARRIVATGFINDPWLEGVPRFAAAPVILTPDEHAALLDVGERVAAVIDEAVQLLADDDEQCAAFVPLSSAQRAMWQASGGLWHGVARADVFATDDGWQITELNSDTPTGEPEAIVLGALGAADHPGHLDACATLPARIAALWRTLHQNLVDDARVPPVAAIIYPTEFTEDLSLVRLYRQLLEESGWQVVLGSPFNLVADGDGLTLFGARPSLVVRHYKTVWWGERESAWTGDEVRDRAALHGPLVALLQAQAARRCAVVNPLGAVVAQNKRVLAFCWERLHRFSTTAQRDIERFIPYTARLEAMHGEQLRADKDSWVLKSDHGAEGDEVVVGNLVDDMTWERALGAARPGRFVVQRFFRARRHDGLIRNHGVFVVGGEACGIYTRLDDGLTDPSSLSVPTLVQPAPSAAR
jgi:glutathionylspermidine synthase